MAKLRLNGSHRQKLKYLASRLVECAAEKAEQDRLYEIAAELVRKMVEKVQPRTDMLILQKYDKAGIDDCIRMQLTSGGTFLFNFDRNNGPLCVNCRFFLADEETTAAVQAHERARNKYQQARQTKLNDYTSLIDTCRTYDEVLAVWPEAEELRASFGATALVTLSDDVVARIKQDVAARAEAA